jgi:hypothetical protein
VSGVNYQTEERSISSPAWSAGLALRVLRATNTEGPRERARHHRGLALALSGSQGAEVWSLRQRLT